MFKCPGASSRIGLLVALDGLLVSGASAAVVGQYSGSASGTIWAGSGSFSTIYGAALAATPSHTVETPEQISAQSLANNSHFIISNPVTAVADMNALVNWVNGGGILMLFVDGTAGAASINLVNSILGSFGNNGLSGSPMQVSNTQLLPTSVTDRVTAASLAGSDPAVGALGGQSLSMYNPFGITGGNALAVNLLGNALRVDTFALGKIYVFGDNFASNSNLSNPLFNSGLTNQQFFLNLLAQGGSGGIGPLDAPEPSTFGLMAVGVIGLLWRFRRNKA